MESDPDELAAVVDLFGGLTREELHAAFTDLAARSGETFDPGSLDAAVDRAIEGYYLVAVDRGKTIARSNAIASEETVEDGTDDEKERPAENELLVAGPTSLPTLPDGGEDLPHLIDVEHRTVDPEQVGRAALSRLRGDAARAVNEEDDERVASLLDVCYDLEAWGQVETSAIRERLDTTQ